MLKAKNKKLDIAVLLALAVIIAGFIIFSLSSSNQERANSIKEACKRAEKNRSTELSRDDYICLTGRTE